MAATFRPEWDFKRIFLQKKIKFFQYNSINKFPVVPPLKRLLSETTRHTDFILELSNAWRHDRVAGNINHNDRNNQQW